MIFKGDLSNFRPSNLLAFLSNLEVHGILTVVDRADVLRIGFKDGAIVSAQCKRVDEKILRILYSRQLIDKEKFSEIRQIQEETNLPAREILENMRLGYLIQHKTIFDFGVAETVFYFFLMESGRYQFADVIVDPDIVGLSMDCRQIVSDVSYWVDEWNEILGLIGSLDGTVMPGAPLGKNEHSTPLVKGIMDLSSRKPSVRDLISMLPVSNLRALKHLLPLVQKGGVKIEKTQEAIGSQAATDSPLSLFAEFKKTSYQIIFSQDVKFRISALARFCSSFFKRVLIFTVKDGMVVQCAAFARDDERSRQQNAIRALNIPLPDDRVFHVAYQSNTAFFGKTFISHLINSVRGISGMEFFTEAGAEECAVIPVHVENGPAVLFFVQGHLTTDRPQPLNYLEILSWILRLEKKRSKGAPPPMNLFKEVSINKPGENESGRTPATGADALRRQTRFSMDLAETLPPVSPMISQILRVLSDPDSSVSELAELVSMDPSLVAQLIKVSNSALYKGFQEVTSLKRALSRLGNKTVRSIVMISATKNLFPTGNAKITRLGQALWRHSVECGLAARRAAIQTGYHDPDAAFTAGVLHDIGKLVILLNHTEGYQHVLKAEREEGVSSVVAENAVFGVNHAQIGKSLMNKWNMPESLVDAVGFHHEPEHAGKSDLLAYIVGYGNLLSHLYYVETTVNSTDENRPSTLTVPQENILAGYLEPLAVSEAGHRVILDALEQEFRNTDLFS